MCFCVIYCRWLCGVVWCGVVLSHFFFSKRTRKRNRVKYYVPGQANQKPSFFIRVPVEMVLNIFCFFQDMNVIFHAARYNQYGDLSEAKEESFQT